MIFAECDIENLCGRLHIDEKKVVFTNGCFDILHAGHVRYLNGARQLGDCLVVGLNSDRSVRALKGEGRPINREMDRAEVLGALRAVDHVVIFDAPTAKGLIEKIRPNLYVKGGDYTLASLPEAETVQSYGGEVRFLPLEEGRSTTNIIKKARASK